MSIYCFVFVVAAILIVVAQKHEVNGFAPLSIASRTSTVQQQMPTTMMTTTARFLSQQQQQQSGENDDVEKLVEEEIAAQSQMSKFTNERGFQYAPWLNVDEKDAAKIRQVAKEKENARLRREEEEQQVKGVLSSDSQAQELSGAGLKSKIIDGNMVELEWATSSEKFTQGFIVKRRPVKTREFDVLASYQDFPPLMSKGIDGGLYRYLDDTGLEPGGYFYRITECEGPDGIENDLSQCLVEIQTEEEQRGTLIAAVGVVAVLIAAVIAGAILDPVQV